MSSVINNLIADLGQQSRWLMDVAILLIVTFILDLIVKTAFKRLAQKKVDKTVVQISRRVIRILIFVIMGLMLMQTLGISISGALAFGGIGGLAVSLAAKDMLANFFGGLMLYLDRPFKVGEWIRSSDKEIEGIVEHIGWRTTVIRTPEKRLLFIPNSVFSTITVENPARMSHRRIQTTVGLRYDDAKKLPVIIETIEKRLFSHPELDSTQGITVRFVELSASSLDILVNVYSHATDWPSYYVTRQNILLMILNIVEEKGAEIAFPTTTVQVSQPLCIQSDSTIKGDP